MFRDGVRDSRGSFALGKGMQAGINLQAADVLAVPPRVQGEWEYQADHDHKSVSCQLHYVCLH